MNEDYDEEWEETFLKNHQENTASFSEKLPEIARLYQESAVKVAHFNEVPAVINFFALLGQICKDFVKIPNGRNIEDTRIHSCQIQTSGSGKSTLYNFTGPIAKNVFARINKQGTHPIDRNVIDEDGNSKAKQFDTFSVQVATSAALIGTWKNIQVMDEDDEGNERPTGRWVEKFFSGALQGHGFAHWDEFEYSGVFSPSQHQQDTVVLLNTMMNTLHGESWVMRKILVDGNLIECFSERSVLAMTYPPKELNSIMTEKGLLQRMLCFIWEVPEAVLDKMRKQQIIKAGIYEDVEGPIEDFTKAIMNIYNTLQAHYKEVLEDGGTAMDTMVYTDDFREVLMLEYESMMNFINSSGLFVREVASNFITRLLKILIKMSVLCSIAQAPAIKNKDLRYRVTGQNVRQAGAITRQCYKTLVEWLERSLRQQGPKSSVISHKEEFINVYDKMATVKEPYINKTLFLQELQTAIGKSQAQIYRIWNEYERFFDMKKIGRSPYLKLKEESR